MEVDVEVVEHYKTVLIRDYLGKEPEALSLDESAMAIRLFEKMKQASQREANIYQCWALALEQVASRLHCKFITGDSL
jgi:hypothetical protein